MISYYIAELFDHISFLFYRLRLERVGKKFNNIANWFYVRGWWNRK